MSRRTALTMGGVGAAFVLAGGAGMAWATGAESRSSGATGAELAQPKLIRSVDGILEVTLTVAASPVLIGGSKVTALTYNGSLPGPTLLVRPGDTLVVTLENHLDDATNLHTHGLHVSPTGSSDNMARHIKAGQTAEYRYEIAATHPPGVFWYHPHLHGTARSSLMTQRRLRRRPSECSSCRT